jgi:hypothetical protein
MRPFFEWLACLGGRCIAVGLGVGIAAGVSAGLAGAEPRLVARFDGAAEYPADQYFGHPDVTVVDSPLGKYRQAGAAVSSRFGYKFKTKVGEPHLLVVEYPDDRRRNMAILDGTCYDIDAGIMTGLAHPLSGKMLQWRQVFWPRWEESSVTIATIGRDEPAAVGKVEVYELGGLDAAAVPALARRPGRRQLGVQFEDPCGTGASLGAMRWRDWLDRLVQYMLYSGQDLLVYPIVWYHHPLYPSQCEPCGTFSTVVGPDRNQYSVWTEQPPDWVGELLETFGRHGLKFKPSLTLLRLGSLMKDMQVDREAIRRGAETYNNMLGNDAVQSSTGDWTPIYNVKNLQARAEGRLSGMAYGENHVSGLSGPMFNPLHPTVEKAVLALVDEIAGKYGKYPAFQGISVNLWHATILWFARPEFGYDDWTIGLFEKETGTKIPVDAGSPDRFSRRFAWLRDHHQEAWFAWRCKKIHELFGKIRDALTAHRTDLTLTVTLWTETTVPQLLGYATGPEHQLFARMSTIEVYRRGGFDVSLYRDMPGVEIHYSPCFARDREKASSGGLATPAELVSTFRDHDFLDRPLLDEMGATRRPGAFVFDCWIEHWGDHKWFPVEAGDRQAERMIDFFGPRAQGIFRLNSYYPEDGFWWKSQLRIAPGFPTNLHYMEHAAFALAEYDALRITRGGLFLDTGHAEAVRDFALAFRTLPDRKFETVGASTDPVALRTLVDGGQRCVYMVNRDYYPVRVQLKPCSGDRAVLTDTVGGQEIVIDRTAEIVLSPYQLRTFVLPSGERVEATAFTIPQEIEGQLVRQAMEFLGQVEELRKKGAVPAGGDRMAEGVRESLDRRWYARLRRQLTSYAAVKAAQLAGAAK